MAGTRMTHIPYKGAGPTNADLVDQDLVLSWLLPPECAGMNITRLQVGPGGSGGGNALVLALRCGRCFRLWAFYIRHSAWGVVKRLGALMHLDDRVAVARIGARSATAFAFRFRTAARKGSECAQQNNSAHHGHTDVNGLGIPVCGA